jgi:hypothetical protein
MSFEETVLAYRLVTGACSGGVEGFLKGIQEKVEYTISEVIELTSNQYGGQKFKEFFA